MNQSTKKKIFARAIYPVTVCIVVGLKMHSALAVETCPLAGPSFSNDAAKIAAACDPNSGSPDFRALVSADKEKGAHIVKLVGQPTSLTCNTAKYDLKNEVEIKPGDSVYFDVPKTLQGRAVTLALLDHRQDPDLPSNKGFQTGVYSTPPGRTSFQIHTKSLNPNGEWRYYNNPSGGVKGSKFASPGGELEHETLFGWYKYGHSNADTDQKSNQIITPDAVRMVSVGKNPVLLGGITLQVAAAPATETETHAFSPGTTFGEPVSEAGQKFGGGQSAYGHFPNAIKLGGYGSAEPAAPLPEGWTKSGSSLTIPIKPGMKVSNLEIAAGDTHPDYDPKDPNAKTNEDGGYGTSGWSKLSIYLQHADGKREAVVERENVPPQGIISGMPRDCNYVSKSGDKLVVEASSDTAYIMGVRLGLRDPKAN